MANYQHGTVLIVDDNEVVREVIRSVVHKLGFSKIIEAENGADALKEVQKASLNQHHLRLVLTDIDMPSMNGLELLSHLRKNPATNHLPVIMLTAHAEREVIIQAVHEGVEGYLIKPFDMDTVRERIEETLEKCANLKRVAA